MDDWKLRHVLEILFFPRVYRSFQFTWGRSRYTNTRAFISKNIPYLLKEYKTLQDACSGIFFFHEDQVLFVDDMPSKCVRNPPFSGYYPFSWNGLDTPRVLNNITEALYPYLYYLKDAPSVSDYVKTIPSDGQQPIDRKHHWFGSYMHRTLPQPGYNRPLDCAGGIFKTINPGL